MITVNVDVLHQPFVEERFQQWEQLSAQIEALHKSRSKEVIQLMAQGVALYEQLLLETAREQATIEEQFELYPTNGRERFLFVKMRPAQFAAYRQLDELFKETKKRVARLRLKVRM